MSADHIRPPAFLLQKRAARLLRNTKLSTLRFDEVEFHKIYEIPESQHSQQIFSICLQSNNDHNDPVNPSLSGNVRAMCQRASLPCAAAAPCCVYPSYSSCSLTVYPRTLPTILPSRTDSTNFTRNWKNSRSLPTKMARYWTLKKNCMRSWID